MFVVCADVVRVVIGCAVVVCCCCVCLLCVVACDVVV